MTDTTISYDDLDLWSLFRIAAFMHAVYDQHGRHREHLMKAAMDCAGWYGTDIVAVVRVWHDVYPDDLRVDIETIKEG